MKDDAPPDELAELVCCCQSATHASYKYLMNLILELNKNSTTSLMCDFISQVPCNFHTISRNGVLPDFVP